MFLSVINHRFEDNKVSAVCSECLLRGWSPGTSNHNLNISVVHFNLGNAQFKTSYEFNVFSVSVSCLSVNSTRTNLNSPCVDNICDCWRESREYSVIPGNTQWIMGILSESREYSVNPGNTPFVSSSSVTTGSLDSSLPSCLCRRQRLSRGTASPVTSGWPV